jgi:signal transduction histidine kinase
MKRVAAGAALAIVYFLTARLGLQLATVGHSVSLVWPPTGLALAILLLSGRWLWPAVLVGAFAVNVMTPGVPVLSAVAIGAGNTAEALIGVMLLQRSGFDPQMRRVGDVLRLTFLVAIGSTVVSAIVGSVSLGLGGAIASAQIPSALRVWWVGDFMGALIVAPLILTARGLASRPSRGRIVEGAVLAVLLFAVGLLAFGGAHSDTRVSDVPPYTLFPLLLWAALRFGPRGAAWSNFTVSAIAVWATVRNLGPFAQPTLGQSLWLLHTFMGMAVLTALLLGAASAERADAVAAREDFISIASHELRTPLTPLTLQVDRLRRLLGRGASPASDLETIRASMERQVLRLSGLIDVLLDVTRLQSGRLPLHREQIDLAAIARETVESLAEQLRVAQCTLTLDASAPVLGEWDRMRLQQALTNLLTNAIKYAAGKPISVRVTAGEKRAELVVTDGGPGISPRDQAQLFHRFARLRANRRSGGLGLGLYITRQIMEAHGGSVTITSKPGGGATFLCTLPLTPTPAMRALADQSRPHVVGEEA